MYILNSPHGSGKSFSISHIACTNTAFLLNIELGLASDAILTLLASFLEVESTHGKKQSRHNSTELLFMIYNSQLILMQTLLKNNPNNFTPFNWWIYVNSAIGREHFNSVFKQLLEYETANVHFESYKLFKYLQRTIREKIGQKPLIFGIDDMGVIGTLNDGKTKSKLDPSTLIGKVFNSLLSYPHNSAIISGSNISQSSIRHLTGELKRDYQIISGYGVVGSSEVYNFIDKLLNVKKVLPDSYVQILASLAKGRRGILFEWLESIIACPPFDSSQTSLEEWSTRMLTSSLENVIQSHYSMYKKCLNDMNTKDMDVASLKNDVMQNLSLRGFINVDELNHQLGLVTRGVNHLSLLNFITNNELAFTVPSLSDSSQYYKIPEPLLMYSVNKALNLEDLIRVSNSWLKKVLKRSDTNERGFAIEIVCGLVMAKISRELNGKPLTDHVLFKSSNSEESFLCNFTLNPNLMLIQSEDIWKVLIGSHKYDYKFTDIDISSFYGTSLDINLRWDGLLLGQPIKSDQKPLIITCGAKMINSAIHPEQFLMNLQSTSISNGFMTKDLKRIQPKCEEDRKFLTSMLNSNPNQDVCNLRILFDYTADATHFEYLTSKEKIPTDIEPRIKSKVVVLSRHNPIFYQWFKESLPETFEIFERYWYKYCYIR
ncbi:Hypothetical protein NAEGRDRAFT_75486 [Naegleria gruberi]|uniref:Uncharacterized protein n=1 Tax=Naegleria gruberi TaxID=5762 RepID=D2W275_NAEGR|nr:uncharacterized protein NAEGRDRAFT_75486 [Naegleria gruberi]EFC36817.1 Hypothetical protein NAEGRDRAFT_75486 [Naegleria gruberi]|eukprot:XP_002669561.1 Hypothetical protein NAEGRDRAFT_75486 [Naegleria gruberi strain NEG-M]